MQEVIASEEIMVVLTARNETRGLEAVEEVKECGLSDYVVFHQLDIMDTSSIATLADFIRTQFGKLDILVNNAGVGGAKVDRDALGAWIKSGGGKFDLELMTQTYEMVIACLETNYYGTKSMIEARVHLLQLSKSPRIVNVSSSAGKLKNIPSEWEKGVLMSDVESLTEEKVDEVLSKFLKDFKEGTLESEGWPPFLSAYIVSKAAMNAHTRILAKKQHTNFCINCVCPGYVKTDMNFKSGILIVEQGAESPARLALLPDGGPSGLFFVRKEESPFY